MNLIQKTWLASWIIITALGWSLGEMIGAFVTGYLVGPGSGSDSIMLRFVLTWAITVVIGGITVGILVGAGQWFLLRVELPKLKWIQTTVLGWIVGITVCFVIGPTVYALMLIGASVLSQGSSDVDAASWSLLIISLITIPIAFGVGWIALGATTGLCQWIELRRSIKAADRYLRSTIVGWFLGLPVTIIVMNFLQPLFIVKLPQTTGIELSTNSAEVALSWLFLSVASGIYGLTVGAVTGITMQRLLVGREMLKTTFGK